MFIFICEPTRQPNIEKNSQFFRKKLNNVWFIYSIINLMGNLLFKRQPRPNNSEPKPVLSKPEQKIIQQPIKNRRYKVVQIYDPRPIFKPISQNKIIAIQKSPAIHELINNQNWNINPQIIEHLIIFNVFQHIEVSNAHVLQVSLYRNVINGSTIKLELNQEEEIPQRQKEEKQFKQKPILQQYSEIYASLFSIKFLQLRKLKIFGQNKLHQQAITSLEVLQYLNSPFLEELHADGHNLTSVKFLRKCHWKRLQTLSLRDTKISDSSHFASVLPYISNSRHIQTINLESQMSQNWMEISWLVKMGFINAQSEKEHLHQDDQSFYMNEGRVLRRVEFGFSKTGNLRHKHVGMIKRKFNNSYIDNPLALW